MRTIPSAIWDRWNAGGPYVGDEGEYVVRLTVEPGWFLNTASPTTDDPTKLPYRWWQSAANDQVEVEVPNYQSMTWDRSLDQDAATANIVLNNAWMDSNTGGQSLILGDPGYFTPTRTGSGVATRWPDLSPNAWEGILVEGAVLRSYGGIGGADKTIPEAVADGNLVLTGVWMVDKMVPSISSDRHPIITLECRDAGSLLVDQPLTKPLVPDAWYPLTFCRFEYTPTYTGAIPVYDSTDPVEVSPDGFDKWVVDIAMGSSNGYWVIGRDGGVFAYRTQFYGSMGDGGLTAPVAGMGVRPARDGYWLVGTDGQVYPFGSATNLGEPVGPLAQPIRRIRGTLSGNGYWMVAGDGGVFAFGDAGYFGGTPVGATTIVDLIPTSSGNGYWLLSNAGGVYAYGDAVYYGGGTATGKVFAGMAAKPDDSGYWLVATDATVYGYGSAVNLGPAPGTLQDPIFGMAATDTGDGYVLVGGDGGVFAYGDAEFFGSLPGGFTIVERSDANYFDFSDIVKLLLLWAGWLLFGSGDDVYGNIETTGTYGDDCLPADLFDKKFVIDGIHAIREIVGFVFHIDEEGAARFESPNWFAPGNYDEAGTYTSFIPEIDEMRQITSYSYSASASPARSEINVASDRALQDGGATRSFTLIPASAPALRGRIKPMFVAVPNSVTLAEMARMASLVESHIWAAQRVGSVSCPYNPAIQLNDQVRIWERSSAETNVHYVRGVSASHDQRSGKAMMTLTTNRLGTPDDWWIG